MIKFILRRVAESIPVLLIVITATFFFIRLAPGGPFDSDKAVSAEVLKNLNERYHLDDPVYKQYFDYLGHLVQGDFGPSFKYPSRTVTEMIMTGFPLTLELGLYAMCFAVFFGIFAGVFASLNPNTIKDYIPMSFSLLGICVPSFLLGPVLVLIFSIWFGWLPVSGWDSFDSKILPVITLGSAYAAIISRLTRSGMLDVLNQDYIRTARAKGLPRAKIVSIHALRGGLLPVVGFLGPALAYLISGSFVVETIFQIPGLGRFYVQAAFNRDYTMILGTTIFLIVLIVLFNMLSDILLVLLNPRLDYENKRT